ncbi:zinc finger RNA-binding protein [Neltuma alba]|uniref:zinc finger RNA-binding protein n=1 Tax=Neltuma alba TaxID=207710 RepID=UPI0010A5318F|nr:zinc finger RNA-binding protein-like [Prosopis alba]
MDYTTVPELQPNPMPAPLSSYPPSVAAYFPPSYPPHYQLYLQNPNPSSAEPQSSIGTQGFHGGTGAEPGANPPGVVASYAPLTSDSVNHLTHEAHADYSYAHNPIADSSSGYYFGPNAQNWAATEAVRQFGVDPAGYGAAIPVASTGSEQLAAANTNSVWWANTTTQPHGNGAWKKHPKKPKTKVVQSAYCEVCKVDCTSKDVLDQHKLGKKHKKNLEKLKEALRVPQVPVPPAVPPNPVIGPQPEGDKSKSGGKSKSKRKAIETPEDLEKKKKKVLEGGAAAEAVKICTICNVVCNSETVFNYHLAGQKHAAVMKKQASLQK